ncbi:MAG: hypothetical protein IKG85_06080 [Clostridia bacterium]|nr:hypothetical protein [Clostridia bacterium]
MKRIVALVLAMLTLSSLSACSPSGDGEFYVCSMTGHSGHSGTEQIFETNDAVYYLCSESGINKHKLDKLWIGEKGKDVWIPLCSKPNCMHNDEDCNAVLEGHAGGRIWLYGQHIYYVSDYSSLWRMRLDGSGHEKLKTFEVDPGGYVGTFFFHDRYLVLIAVVPPDGRTDSDVNEPKVYVVDLSMNELEMRNVELVTESEGRKTIGYPLIGDEKYIYTVLDDCTLLRFDLESGTLSEICMLPFYPEEIGIRKVGDKLYFYEPWTAGMAVSVDVNTGMTDEIKRVEPGSECWYTICGEHEIGVDPGSGDLMIYDDKCVFETSVPVPEGTGTIFPMWTLDEVVYGFEYVNGEESILTPPQWYLDLSKLGTGNLTWRRWAPDGE